MREYYPRPRRGLLSHPIRSLATAIILIYGGWAFRGCVEKPETLAYRLNREIASRPTKYESLTDKEADELHGMKSRAHRHHPTLEGFIHPKDVRLIWAEDKGKDYALVQLRSGHEYAIRQDGLKERFDWVSKGGD